MLTVQKVLFLRRVELFSTLNSSQLGHLASIAEEVVYPAGTSIFSEGDYGEAMFVIVDGEVKIHRGAMQLALLKENHCFGEMSILDGQSRSASATAVGDCLMLRITQSEFQGILSTSFETAQAIMRWLSERIRKVEGREKELAGRVAELSREGSHTPGS